MTYYICTICINVKLVSLRSVILPRNSWISEVGGKRIDICSLQSDGKMDGSWWLNLLKRLGSVDHNASCRHTRQIHPCPSRLQNKQSPLSMTTRSCRSRILGVLSCKIWIDRQRKAENIKNKDIEYSILIGSSCISFCRHSLLRFGRYRPLHNSCIKTVGIQEWWRGQGSFALKHDGLWWINESLPGCFGSSTTWSGTW